MPKPITVIRPKRCPEATTQTSAAARAAPGQKLLPSPTRLSGFDQAVSKMNRIAKITVQLTDRSRPARRMRSLTIIRTMAKRVVTTMSNPVIPANPVSVFEVPPTTSFRMPLRCRTQFQILAITTGDSMTG